MPCSKRAPAMLLCVLLFALAGCGAAPAATQTPFIIVVTAGPGSGVSVGLASPVPGTAAPTATTIANTVAPTLPPSAPTDTVAPTQQPEATTSAQQTLATYTGSRAPFTVAYPSSWAVSDPERNSDGVIIVARDGSAFMAVDYKAAGTETPDQVLSDYLKGFGTPEPQVTNQTRNIDGSLKVELEYTAPDGHPRREIVRVVKQATSAYAYEIFFDSTPENFAQARALGMTLVNSFREQAPTARKSTPPRIARPTATPTAIPAPDTDTPQPTDTPEPPPTNTPRPPVALFQLDAQARGYENWGFPKDGCNSGATGQFDNNHTVKRLTVDIVLTNHSGRPIQVTDITAGMFSNTGAELLLCTVSSVPTAPSGGSSSFGLTTFVEKDQFLSALRMVIFGSTVRVCFGRNNPPSVVGCG